MIGDLCFEPAIFILNPINEILNYHQIDELLESRINIFAEELGATRERIIGWCFVRSVLGYIWAVEDKENPSIFLNLAKKLYKKMNN